MMGLRIFQINLDRDENGVSFENYDYLSKAQPDGIDSRIYDLTYDGYVDAKNLEDVFTLFNTDRPDDFRGRSLSVSDVVKVVSSDSGVKPGYYYCDSFGFKEVPFDESLVQDGRNPDITVVLVEPGKYARTATIGSRLEDLQKVVGGLIEPFYPFDDPDTCIVCNEEGKFNGMAANRIILDSNDEPVDIICGPFFICDCSGENFASLDKKRLKEYTELFRKPHRFLSGRNGFTVMEYDPVEQKQDDPAR